MTPNKQPKPARTVPSTLLKARFEYLDKISGTTKQSAGFNHLKRHTQGIRLTQRQAILAQCCECMGFYADGRMDCESAICPLYPYMPYRKKEGAKE